MNYSPFALMNQYDSDAVAFIDATGLTNNHAEALNELVVSLKGEGLWDYMIGIYPMTGESGSHKYNLKDPRDTDDAFRLTFHGNWTVSLTGSKPDIGSWADTHALMATNCSMSYSEGHMAFFTTDMVDAANSAEMGSFGGGKWFLLTTRWSNDQAYAWWGDPAGGGTSNTDTRGFWIVNRGVTGEPYVQMWKNGSKIISDESNVPATNAEYNIAIGMANNGSVSLPTTQICNFSSIGLSLPEAKVPIYNTIVNKYITDRAKVDEGIPSAYANFLLVAGGGGGGQGDRGGGGGAGGCYIGGIGINPGTYTITVGGGGAPNTSGNDSVFGSKTAFGGGYGGQYRDSAGSGGSGGGAPDADGQSAMNNPGGGIIGQGYPGGKGYFDNDPQILSSGGGGGATMAGQDASSTPNEGSCGGNGLYTTFNGTGSYYAGGGGGGRSMIGTNTHASGGLGGGGEGGYDPAQYPYVHNGGSDATVNTGGGGGGVSWGGSVGGNGGSGIVMIKYRSSTPKATGGTITATTEHIVHTFTASGEFTWNG